VIWPSSIDLALHENADAYRVCLLSEGLDLGSKVWSQQFGIGEVFGGRVMARNTQLYCRFHPPGNRPEHTGSAKRYLCWSCEEALIVKAGTTVAPAFLHHCKPDVVHTLNGNDCPCRQPA
jgi:hypothetical protein